MEPKKSTMGFYEENPNGNVSENGLFFSGEFEKEQRQNLQEYYEKVIQKSEREHKKLVHDRYVLGTMAVLCVVIISILTSYVLFDLVGMKIPLLLSPAAGDWKIFGGLWYLIAVISNSLIGLLYFKKTSAPFNAANILFFSLFVLSYNLFFWIFCLLEKSQDYWVLIVPILAFWVIMNIKMVMKFNLYHRIKELLKPVLQWRK
ncbi:MAG: hypothetical protein ACI4M3_04990 [Acutalibacteraceae bacterium]